VDRRAAPLSRYPAPPSFRTEQADFFFRIRSCECVGLRREKSLFVCAFAFFTSMSATQRERKQYEEKN